MTAVKDSQKNRELGRYPVFASQSTQTNEYKLLMAISEVDAPVMAMQRYEGDDAAALRLKKDFPEQANIDPPPSFP